jgi:hypothetical protein
MNYRTVNAQGTAAQKIEEKMFQNIIKDKARAEGARLLRKYHGKKIFVF